ncbi:MAG: hypothetical protein KF819_31635 [Labilithrix sp.]|nr:hypothetical protein [Labilithrix sp.]
MKHAAAVVALFALACTTTKGAGPDEPRTAPATTVGIAPVAPTAIVQENAIQTAEAPPARPPAKPSLGDPCKAGDPSCGTKGRVAMTVEMKNIPGRKREVPCEMQEVPSEGFGEHGAGCVKDDKIYLASDCIECRMYSRWEMTGVVAEMTDPQLVLAQRRVGLGPEPILRTTEGWRTALASAKGRRRP